MLWYRSYGVPASSTSLHKNHQLRSVNFSHAHGLLKTIHFEITKTINVKFMNISNNIFFWCCNQLTERKDLFKIQTMVMLSLKIFSFHHLHAMKISNMLVIRVIEYHILCANELNN